MNLRREGSKKGSTVSRVLWLRGWAPHPGDPSSNPTLHLTQMRKGKSGKSDHPNLKPCFAKDHVKRLKRSLQPGRKYPTEDYLEHRDLYLEYVKKFSRLNS